MKKLLLFILMYISLISQGKVVKQYNGLIIKGECKFDMQVRSKKLNITGSVRFCYLPN